LIVDDDPDMAETIRAVLDSEGYRSRWAANGVQALEEVASEMPAVILLDMLMPVMNGWDCARELRARYGRGVPIVVMTAAEHAESRRDEVGADEVLPKPFDLHDLLRIVGTYLPGPGAGVGATP
jgi:CheY-like chemotaxis protein